MPHSTKRNVSKQNVSKQNVSNQNYKKFLKCVDHLTWNAPGKTGHPWEKQISYLFDKSPFNRFDAERICFRDHPFDIVEGFEMNLKLKDLILGIVVILLICVGIDYFSA